jgi:outer membrane protein assembly factor BamB
MAPEALDPPDEPPPLEELPPLEDEPLLEDAGVDEDDFDPEAGGEPPQPASTRAIATSAAPNQVLPGLVSVLFMFERPPCVSVVAAVGLWRSMNTMTPPGPGYFPRDGGAGTSCGGVLRVSDRCVGRGAIRCRGYHRAAMLTPGRRRRPRREPVLVAALLLAVGIAAAVILLSSAGDPPPKPKPKARPTRKVVHKRVHRVAVDNFVWPFYGYDGARSRSFSAPRNLSPPLRKGWRYNDFRLLEFPPVLYHNAMFFIDYSGLAKAVNKLTGRRLWKRKVGTLAAASPAVDPGRGLVFYSLLSESRGATLPGNGRLVALSTKTGRIVWARNLPAGSESSPLVHRGNVYVGDAGGSVYSLGTAHGRLHWTFHASGAVKGALAYSGGRLYFGDYASRVYAVKASNGHEAWATTLAGGAGRIYGSTAVAFGRVFVGNTNGHVYALSKSSGQLVWDRATSAYVYSSPAAANVPGLGPTVFVGSYDGNFYALNGRSGAVRWSHASDNPISGSGTVIGHVVYYGVLRAKDSIGLDSRTGHQVFFYPDGEFASAVADHRALYLIGAASIYEMLPRRK